MSFFAKLAVTTRGRKAVVAFEESCKAPSAAQRRRLLEIATRNRDTEYGRRYGFRGVTDLQSWQRSVPVITFEDIRRQIERISLGEKCVLTSEPPLFFAQTSGSSGRPKLIPVTPTCRANARPMQAWLYSALRQHPRLFGGKVLSLVSPAVEGYTAARIPYGSTSGLIYRNLPWIIRNSYAIPYEAFEIKDYATKYYLIMAIGIASDVSFLCTANPSSILKLLETAIERAEDLVRDLTDGTLSWEGLRLDHATRERFRASIPKNPTKARGLARSIEKRGGRLLPADYWPNLELIGCWKGGTVGAHTEKFDEYFNPEGRRAIPVRDWGYLSSEARCSVPLSDEGSGGVLAVESNVYEFVRVDEMEDNPERQQAWNFLGVDDVQEGQEYYIFFSTTGGLYRYDINDIVRVVGRYHLAPIIEFRRKGRGMTNITGEKISATQVIEALKAASRSLGVRVDHFKVEADAEASRYIVKIESRRGISSANGKDFISFVDQQLCNLNIEYQAKRSSLRLHPPILHIMKVGWHEKQRQAEIRDRGRDFQRKTKVLGYKTNELDDDIETTVQFEERHVLDSPSKR